MTTKEAVLPATPVPAQVIEATRWWLEERTGWPLQRALPVWLSYEGGYWWNPDDAQHREAYGAWHDAAIVEAGRRNWE